jgi:hypothetical protein
LNRLQLNYPILIEVMDREATIPGFGIGELGFGIVGFYAGRWRRLAGLPIIALVLLGLGQVGASGRTHSSAQQYAQKPVGGTRTISSHRRFSRWR